MDKELTENIKSKSQWLRALFMVLFIVINYFVRFIIIAIALFQFIIVLMSAKKNNNLLKFGKSLSTYSYQIMLYITYNSEDKPFPFGNWPNEEKPKAIKNET